MRRNKTWALELALIVCFGYMFYLFGQATARNIVLQEKVAALSACLADTIGYAPKYQSYKKIADRRQEELVVLERDLHNAEGYRALIAAENTRAGGFHDSSVMLYLTEAFRHFAAAQQKTLSDEIELSDSWMPHDLVTFARKKGFVYTLKKNANANSWRLPKFLQHISSFEEVRQSYDWDVMASETWLDEVHFVQNTDETLSGDVSEGIIKHIARLPFVSSMRPATNGRPFFIDPSAQPATQLTHCSRIIALNLRALRDENNPARRLYLKHQLEFYADHAGLYQAMIAVKSH